MNIAVLASHEGTTLQAILDACRSGVLDARVGIQHHRQEHCAQGVVLEERLYDHRNEGIRALAVRGMFHGEEAIDGIRPTIA